MVNLKIISLDPCFRMERMDPDFVPEDPGWSPDPNQQGRRERER